MTTRLSNACPSNSRTHLPGWLGACSTFATVPTADHALKKRRDGAVRLPHVQANNAILVAHRIYARQRLPRRRIPVPISQQRELDYVMSAKPFNQIRRRTLSNDLAVINNHQ